MKNWNIGTRITVGFAAVIAIAMALGVFAYGRIGVINASAIDIAENSLPSVYVMGQIHTHAQKTLTLQLEHINSSDAQDMARVEAELREVHEQQASWYEKYEKLFSNDEDRRLFADMSAARKAFNDTWDEILPISRIGTPEANKRALNIANTRLRPLHTHYLETIDKEISFNQDLAAEASRNIASAVSSARSGILIGIVAALVIAVGISFFVVQSITRPLAVAVTLVDQVAEGDLTHTVDITSSDEVGRLLRSMNAMVVNLKNTAQVATSISEGDLTIKAQVLSDKDILGQALVSMIENLRNTVSQVASAASNVSSGSAEMSATAQHCRRVPPSKPPLPRKRHPLWRKWLPAYSKMPTTPARPTKSPRRHLRMQSSAVKLWYARWQP